MGINAEENYLYFYIQRSIHQMHPDTASYQVHMMHYEQVYKMSYVTHNNASAYIEHGGGT